MSKNSALNFVSSSKSTSWGTCPYVGHEYCRISKIGLSIVFECLFWKGFRYIARITLLICLSKAFSTASISLYDLFVSLQ